MISVYKIKPKFQQLLRPVLSGLRRLGISPNTITWSAILLSLAMGIFFYLHPYGSVFLLLPLTLLLRMTLNALDGMMAKTYNLQSRGGEVLNELGDVVSDIFLFFPFYFLPQANALLVLTFLFLSVLNEFVGVLAKAVSGERRYDGPMGKSDRALFIGVLCLLLYFYPAFSAYLNLCFTLACVLLIVSTGVRLYKSLKS